MIFNALPMVKTKTASTASSSENYSEETVNQNMMMANKLNSDHDSIISSYIDSEYEEDRSLSYLLSFYRPVLEWQTENLSQHLALFVSDNVLDD